MDEENVLLEETGDVMFPKSCLKTKASQETFLKDAETYARVQEISERTLPTFMENMRTLHDKMDDTTELWEYDDLGPLCGSSGLAVIRKETGKLVAGHILIRS